MNIEEIKNKAAPVLKSHDVRHAGIFGSLARGDAKEGSDLDILVELGEEKSLLDLVALKIELEEATQREVDVVEYCTIHPRLKERILKEQVVVI